MGPGALGMSGNFSMITLLGGGGADWQISISFGQIFGGHGGGHSRKHCGLPAHPFLPSWRMMTGGAPAGAGPALSLMTISPAGPAAGPCKNLTVTSWDGPPEDITLLITFGLGSLKIEYCESGMGPLKLSASLLLT